MAADDDPTEERSDSPTPSGGVASVVYYRDAQGNPAPKSQAVAAEAHEFDADGQVIRRIYFDLAGSTDEA